MADKSQESCELVATQTTSSPDRAQLVLGSPSQSQHSGTGTTTEEKKEDQTAGSMTTVGEHSMTISGENEPPERLFSTQGNPFIMPPDHEIFLLRDKERQRKKQERIRQRNLHVHEKTTFSSRVHCRPAAMIHPTKSDVDLRKADKAAAVADDTQFTLAITRDRHVDKESLAEYIAKKREMFLVQYSLGVKRDEMRKLEEIAQAEERKLELAEQFLEEDASMFDDFLKENDKNSVEAIKVAEAEAKSKMDKLNEIKKIQIAIMAVKSEISKFEETLREYKTYKVFLDQITPPELIPEGVSTRKGVQGEDGKEGDHDTMHQHSSTTLLEIIQKGGKKKSIHPKGPLRLPARPSTRVPAHPMTRRKSLFHSPRKSICPQTAPTKKELPQQEHHDIDMDIVHIETEEVLNLWFTDPQQVLDIFAALEEQNLSLIQNSQEAEENLEEMKRAMRNTRKKMTAETKGLKEQIDKLNASIAKENAKGQEFQAKATLFRGTEEAVDKPPVSMDTVVEEVYRSCIGENDANMSTIQMLTALENKLEELFDIIETIPHEKVEAAEKMKEKERRLFMREEKLEEQRLYYEERVRRALERARAEPKTMTGRKLVYRSEPPRMKKTRDDGAERARRREEEEFNYYFTWG